MMRFSFSAAFLLFVGSLLGAREFTVLVYNVENLFDVDGVALYDDYNDNTWDPENPYTPQQLYTKLDHIARILAAVNDGLGPEVILFQEFELDRTPFGSQGEPARLVEPWLGMSVAEMLGPAFDREVANLPVHALLWKLLEERGQGGYAAAVGKPSLERFPTAHHNVVFSRFPISEIRQRPMAQARDLQVVELSVEGHPFVVLNNHWKSGASSRDTAPIRYQNALVVRAELEAILLRDPDADVLVAGDLNSHYNQSAVFPDWAPVGVNEVLGSQTDEAALAAGDGPLLYNLWGELPLEERGSEVYRGRWGTLMQMLVTRGLYDREGIRYIDNSFFRLILPGVNVDPVWGAPVRWIGLGRGAGFSDHLPIGARFTAGDPAPAASAGFTRERRLPAHQPVVPYARLPAEARLDATILNRLSVDERLGFVGQLFDVSGRVAANGDGIEIGDRLYGLYLPPASLRERWDALQPGASVRFVAEYGVFRGREQFVVRDSSWWR